MTTFGALQIVAIQDLGPAGPRESEPVTYHWPLYLHLMPLILLVLLIALLLRDPNRVRGAWLVLLPMLLCLLLSVAPLGQGMFVQFLLVAVDSFILLFFGLACLWLLADMLGGLTGIQAFVGAVGLLAGAGAVGLFALSSLSLGVIHIPMVLIYCIVTGMLLVAMLSAGAACRKRYTPSRFLLVTLIICVLLTTALFAILGLISGLLFGMDTMHLLLSVTSMLVSGITSGVFAFCLLLPFIAMALWSPAYKPRFHAIFQFPQTEAEA